MTLKMANQASATKCPVPAEEAQSGKALDAWWARLRSRRHGGEGNESADDVRRMQGTQQHDQPIDEDPLLRHRAKALARCG
jgi:hypothetical protein